jgi:hypothetical protein
VLLVVHHFLVAPQHQHLQQAVLETLGIVLAVVD